MTRIAGSLGSCLVTLAVAAPADAGVYISLYTLSSPYTVTTPDVTQVLVSWSTNSLHLVEADDLVDWSISFLSGGNLFYTDQVIVGGVVQPLGGVERTLADVLFNFDLLTMTPGNFDNMLPGASLSGAVGPAYNVYSYPDGPFEPPYSTFGIWANGDESTRQLLGFSSVVTVPAPAALAIAALAGLAPRRRRR